jgi:predicted  nucleic acid-binding Zn-ribbon protein
LKDQLKLLLEVQRHDARIQELEGMQKVWPQKLEALTGDLKKVEAMLARERAQLEETESWRRRQEQEMKDEEAQLLKAKQKSSLVKNAKEMMANERELQVTRKMAQEREEEVLKLVNAVEAAKKSIAQHEADFEALKKHVGEEEATAKVKMGEIDGQIAEERKLREVAAARVEPSAMKKYSTIRMRRGLALVPVKNGTCAGCNMNIPPQLFNTIQRGNSIELCGNCNRIIYWDKLLEETDGKPSEKPEPPAQ